MYRDQYGLIVQSDGDGGDTAQRTGFYYLGKYLTGYCQALYRAQYVWQSNLLEVKPGILVRHPFQPEFRSDPNEFARDQQDVCVITAGYYNRPLLKRIALAQLKRFGMYQNKDVPQLQTPGIFIRASRIRFLWPLLLLTDIGLVISSITSVINGRNKPGAVDDLNHVARLLQAHTTMPTPVSFAARKLFSKYRAKNYGCAGVTSDDVPESNKYNETNNVMGALVFYCRTESKGNPEIAELYRPLIEEYFT